MNVTITELISESAIKKRTAELAEQIERDFGGNEIVMICILKGGVMFMVDLARYLKCDVEIHFMGVSSYGNAMKSSGEITIELGLAPDVDIKGKNVLIVEDIIDTGRTLKFLTDYIKERNPNNVRICTLLDKPEQRIVDIKVEYVGFTIPDSFVVGYGLDYAQKYRNLNYIGVLSFNE